MEDIVCISHLRWNFVWQRPQHLLSRFAHHNRVVIVEEPVADIEAIEPYLEILKAEKTTNVTIVRLVYPSAQPRWIGHGDPATQRVYNELLNNYLNKNDYERPILWMYTPMGLEFADTIEHDLLVYDVMDQLAAFKGAPADLPEREKTLLRSADIVFTGGMSLYRDKQSYNSQTHLFPSGVETEHFAAAGPGHNFEKPTDLQNINSPILGYYGVIDERMDLELLAAISQAHPDWQLVMLGPVVKIDPTDLPQAPNIHYLGLKNYEQLPGYLAFFDVALIPFAINESTRFLSPTKTLEYMAAHKPIVSTPISDVIELYGEVVRVGHSHQEFMGQVQNSLHEFSQARREKEKELLATYSWDSITTRMLQLIAESTRSLTLVESSTN